MTPHGIGLAIASQGPVPTIELSNAVSRFASARQWTEDLCRPLIPDDYVVQPMADVSPPKWHLGHTTWFFETFLLSPFLSGYRPFHPAFHHLFNSYYETVGSPWERTRRGVLSRPGVDEVYQYRAYVDEQMRTLLVAPPSLALSAIRERVEIGIQHEQQHQELLAMDIKNIFWSNPLRPIYREGASTPAPACLDSIVFSPWVGFEGGLIEIGADANWIEGFAFDSEKPKHKVYLENFSLARNLVTNGEYLEFMRSGAYRDPRSWLADGWRTVQAENWDAPLYWEKIDEEWWVMTLQGMRRVNEREPVCHVSYYEADAFARWRGLRLPTESEWERAASISGSAEAPLEASGTLELDGFLESLSFHPLTATAPSRPGIQDHPESPNQLFGTVWEWTSSPYQPYPGFCPLEGALGEYNGKFMCNQMVLRGGCCVTPASHFRKTYRNFFNPGSRWQFSGIRLAQGGEA